MKICAPFAGIVHYKVAEGTVVKAGDILAVVETVKLEAPVVALGPGIVERHTHADFSDVVGGDVLLELGKG